MTQEESKKEFEKRTRSFLEEFKLLQKKFKINCFPIITEIGPDLRIVDVIESVKEEKK